jgi:hypothetical protein
MKTLLMIIGGLAVVGFIMRKYYSVGYSEGMKDAKNHVTNNPKDFANTVK